PPAGRGSLTMLIDKTRFRKLLDAGEPAFGMTLYTAAPMTVEALGNWGLDFAFIDTEHANFRLGGADLERMVLAARWKQVAALIRVPGIIDHDIRKAYEMGAEGVIVPQVRTAGEM